MKIRNTENAPWYIRWRHLWLALFWVVFGLGFFALERLVPREYYHPQWRPLDDLIPFHEAFLIPYMFWFVYLIGAHVYTGLTDPAAFRRLMAFIMLTYGAALVIFAVYPTCQELRPTEFARDNALTRFMAWFYTFDTNTNVNPSLHVCGSFAAAAAFTDTKKFSGLGWKIANWTLAILISVSTVFVKQHSVIDMFWGLLLSLAAYLAVYCVDWNKLRSRLVRKSNAEL